MFESLRDLGFDVEFESHASAILERDFPDAVSEVEATLRAVRIPVVELIEGGGGEALVTQRLRRAFAAVQWNKVCFEVVKTINGNVRESISHEIDHVKTFPNGVIVLELEWNNKDPFFDRDLENFKRLHADAAISLGIIVTRGRSLQAALPGLVHRYAINQDIDSVRRLDELEFSKTNRQRAAIQERLRRGDAFPLAWSTVFVHDKFGVSTTHWDKLLERRRRGVGSPCPLVLLGLPVGVVQE